MKGNEALILLLNGEIIYNTDINFNYRLNKTINKIEVEQENHWNESNITINDFLTMNWESKS